jgi:hypothetical protein
MVGKSARRSRNILTSPTFFRMSMDALGNVGDAFQERRLASGATRRDISQSWPTMSE